MSHHRAMVHWNTDRDFFSEKTQSACLKKNNSRIPAYLQWRGLINCCIGGYHGTLDGQLLNFDGRKLKVD